MPNKTVGFRFPIRNKIITTLAGHCLFLFGYRSSQLRRPYRNCRSFVQSIFMFICPTKLSFARLAVKRLRLHAQCFRFRRHSAAGMSRIHLQPVLVPQVQQADGFVRRVSAKSYATHHRDLRGDKVRAGTVSMRKTVNESARSVS